MKNHGTAKKLLRIGLNLLQSVLVTIGRILGAIDFPVPPNSSIRKTAGKTIRSYYMGGVRSFLPIATCAQNAAVRLDSNINVLDFGCGVGRQLLHFTRKYPAPAFFACDLDDTSIAFIQKSYPNVNSYANKFTPPLRYDNGYFDMIYSVSIFSHLNMEDQVIWLQELARVTKAGGYCFLTTEGFSTLKPLADSFGQDPVALRSLLDRQGYIYKEYPDWQECVKSQNTLRIATNMVGVERSYGNTVLSPKYIRENWPAAGFEVCSIVETIIDDRQDLIVLRRT